MYNVHVYVTQHVVLQMCQYMHTTLEPWPKNVALAGHQGSSLSLKHGLCVSAFLNTQLHSRQGEAPPPVVGVQKLDQGHGALQNRLSY